MLLTSAVAVGSRADVVDQRTVAGGHMSAGSGMIRPFQGGLERRDRASIDGTGFGAAVGVARCIQGPELQIRFRADEGRPSVEAQYVRYERTKAVLRAIAKKGLQAAVELVDELSRGAVPEGVVKVGPGPWAMARADGSANESADSFSNDWRWWDHRDRWQALFFEVRQADGATSGFQGPGLWVNVGKLVIWAMGADGEVITKQEAALTVLQVMRVMVNSRGRQ
jgi:hypothetical protein